MRRPAALERPARGRTGFGVDRRWALLARGRDALLTRSEFGRSGFLMARSQWRVREQTNGMA